MNEQQPDSESWAAGMDSVVKGAFAKQQGHIESLEQELARLREAADAMRSILKGYEQWEADIILDDNCWRDSLPQLTQAQSERLIELQQLRNAALGGSDE